jgi:acyl-CoA synthetase (AMP-forming)/AMP-acid ligase II
MIKSSGFRISPTEVEEVAFRSGAVRHAAAIGVPDDLLGQAVKLFVVPRDDKSAVVDKSALLEFCGEHLPRYMVPKFVEVLNELPVTSSGKVDYPSLRRREGVA